MHTTDQTWGFDIPGLDSEVNNIHFNEGPDPSSSDVRRRHMSRLADFHQSFSRIASNHRLSSDNLMNILKDAGKRPPSGERPKVKSPWLSKQTSERNMVHSETKSIVSNGARVMVLSAMNSPQQRGSEIQMNVWHKKNKANQFAKVAGKQQESARREEASGNTIIQYKTPQKDMTLKKLDDKKYTQGNKTQFSSHNKYWGDTKPAYIKERIDSGADGAKIVTYKASNKNKLKSFDSPPATIKGVGVSMFPSRLELSLGDEVHNNPGKIVYTEPNPLNDSNMLQNIEKSRHWIVGVGGRGLSPSRVKSRNYQRKLWAKPPSLFHQGKRDFLRLKLNSKRLVLNFFPTNSKLL